MDRRRDYKLLSAIGAGTTSTVFLALNNTSKRYVAIKRIGKDLDPRSLKRIHREIELVSTVNSPFIVPYYETFEDDKYLYIVMDACDGGSLTDLITNNGPMREDEARILITELAFALYYLHNERGIIHRDVKVDNILLDQYGHVKLSDFGFSTRIENHEPAKRTVCGSPAFCAPELVRHDKYTPKTDIWGAGVVLYVMLMGHLPFTGRNIQECMHEILEKEPAYSPRLSEECRSLLDGMLAKDSSARLNAEDLLKHPFIANGRLFTSIERVSKLRWSGPFSDIEEERKDKMMANYIVLEKTFELLGCKANGFKPSGESSLILDHRGPNRGVRSYVMMRPGVNPAVKRSATHEITTSSSLRGASGRCGVLGSLLRVGGMRRKTKAQTFVSREYPVDMV